MLSNETIIYLGNFHFPKGNAAGKRVYGNSVLFKELGYTIKIIDTDPDYTPLNYKLSQKRVQEGFDCRSLPYPNGLKGWLKFPAALKEVESFILSEKDNSSVFAVVIYGSPTLSLFNFFLIKFCNKNDVKVIVDCVDWLTVKSKSFVFNLIKSADDSFQKILCNKMADGVICISSFLSNYYDKSKLETIIIPPLNIKDREEHILPSVTLNSFIYAGRPFRDDMQVDDVASLKDRVDLIFKIFSDLKLEGYNFKLHIYGFSSKEFLKCVPSSTNNIEMISNEVFFHGHASNLDVVNTLESCSFSLLFRDSKRDTIAGFPTKVSESISVGTPVIVSEVGDIGDYIVENVNGYLSQPNDYQGQLNSVRKALDCSAAEVNKMKINCLNDGNFLTKKYQSSLADFLKSL
jgi:glycosyltransferase involved in cell wall biosynthesis